MPQRRVGRAWKRLPVDAHKQRRLSLEGQQSRLAYNNAFTNEFLRRASAGALRELGGEHSELQREYSGSNDSSHTSNEGSVAGTEHSNEGSIAEIEQQQELSERRLRYHSSSPFHTREGYLGGLTDRQSRALCALRSKCYCAHEQPEEQQPQQQHGHVDISSITATAEPHLREDTDLCLLRFLRTHKWDVELTLTALAENAAWRCEQKTALMRSQRPSQVLGCSEETVKQIVSCYYPHWYLGDDRHGRPCLLYKYGKFDTRALLQLTSMQSIQLYHIWEQEQNCTLLARNSRAYSHIVETYCLVLDFKGMGLHQVCTSSITVSTRV
jgi:CRAL/TRIO domain/CRAL/TRIO, N-terminal domain